MDITIELTVDDWHTFQTFIASEIPRKFYSGWLLGVANFFIWFAFAIVFMGIINIFSSFHWPSAISIAMIFIILMINNFINMPKLLLKSLEPSIDGPFCGQHKFNFSQTKISAVGDGCESKHSWKIVKKVVSFNGLVMLFIDTSYALIIPIRNLENPDEFIRFAEERINENRSDVILDKSQPDSLG